MTFIKRRYYISEIAKPVSDEEEENDDEEQSDSEEEKPEKTIEGIMK